MQVVPQKISTNGSTMAIINSEETTLGPLLILVSLGLRFHNIENNGDPILIVISNNTLVGIGTVACDQPISLIRILGILIIRQYLMVAFVRLTEGYLASNLIEVQVAATQAFRRLGEDLFELVTALLLHLCLFFLGARILTWGALLVQISGVMLQHWLVEVELLPHVLLFVKAGSTLAS